MDILLSAYFVLLSATSSPNNIDVLLQLASSTTKCENNENTKIIAEEILLNASHYIKNDISPALPFKIACAESRYKNVPNFKYHEQKYSAFGIFQFTKTTFNEFCKGDRTLPKDNIQCAVRMIGEGKQNHWSESSQNWSSESP